MNTSESRQLLLAGLPETGKTSFLALFYLALVNAPTKRLRLASFQNDREYLNEISERLMRCEEAVYTHVGERRELSLSLELLSTNSTVTLRIPDLSGETWEDAVLKRFWSQEVDGQVRSSETILFFLHPDQIDAGPTTGAVNQAAVAIGGDPPPNTARSRQNPREKKVELKGNPPTQVLVVDLLQLTIDQRGARPARACIIISAWDRAPKGMSPEEFIAENLPLLDQYISSNRDWLSLEVYGVSAQGGDFKKAAAELAEVDPLERADVIAGDGSLLEIEDPIAWALGLD